MGLLVNRSLSTAPASHLADHDQLLTVYNDLIPARAFGVLADNSNDDTAELQAAFDAVPTGGGVVLLPPGRIKVSSTVQIKVDGTQVWGSGMGGGSSDDAYGTRIVAATGMTGAVLRVQRNANDHPCSHVGIRDLIIDGASIGTGVVGLHFRSYQGYVQNVMVHDCTGFGVHVEGYAGWATYDTRLHSILIKDCDDAGLRLSTRAEDCHFTQVVSLHNKYGSWISAASAQFTACHFYDNTENNLFFDGGGTRTKVVGCKIEGAPKHQVVVDGSTGGISELQFIGNGFCSHNGLAGGIAANNTYDHLFVTAGANWADRITIVGNQFKHQTQTNKHRYGINLSDSGSGLATIVGNTFGDDGDFATKQMNIVPTSVTVDGNTNGGTANEGTGTINSGSTSTVITHGLDFTPVAADIYITQTSTATNQGPFWVTTITSTQFTVNHTDPGAGNVTFSWRAKVF